MFNLNFDEGRPIAFINGGDYDKEILQDAIRTKKFQLYR